MTHVKLRAGYDLGEGMIYGVAGWAETSLGSTISSLRVSEQGTVIGLGYEHRIGTRMSVGAEYLRTSVNDLAGSFDLDFESVQARVSFRF
jgi:hypothetical protein